VEGATDKKGITIRKEKKKRRCMAAFMGPRGTGTQSETLGEDRGKENSTRVVMN